MGLVLNAHERSRPDRRGISVMLADGEALVSGVFGVMAFAESEKPFVVEADGDEQREADSKIGEDPPAERCSDVVLRSLPGDLDSLTVVHQHSGKVTERRLRAERRGGGQGVAFRNVDSDATAQPLPEVSDVDESRWHGGDGYLVDAAHEATTLEMSDEELGHAPDPEHPCAR